MSETQTTPKMPPVLSTEARRLLVWWHQWDVAEDGTRQLTADQVPAAAELLAAGQIRLHDYKGRIEVEMVR